MVYQFLIVIDGNKVTIRVWDLAPSWSKVGDDLIFEKQVVFCDYISILI